MSRWEFMRQLEELLFDISPNEREEALQYYNDYFNDAGKENEKEVIEALGSPEQVAKIVKDGLSENGSQGEFTETGFSSASVSSQNAVVKRSESVIQKENEFADGRHAPGADPDGGKEGITAGKKEMGAGGREEKKESMPAWAIVLIVIGCIFLSPVILAVVCAAGGILIGFFGAVLGIVLGVGAAALALYIVAAALFVAGFGCILVHPAAGIGLLGGGCICAALGIVFMLLVGFLAGILIPSICQGIAYIFKKLFDKKGGAKA